MNRLFSSIKRRWQRYINKLAAANQKSYGSQKLDCCGLNSDKPAAGKSEVKQ